jgi:antitoxin ChpS
VRRQAGDRVHITAESGRLVVESQPDRRYTLNDLLVQCDPKASRTKQEGEWLDTKSVGRELI